MVFEMLGVKGNTSYGADLYTLRLVKMSHAFGAFRRVDFVNFFTQINRLVRALRLTHIAVDAFIGDHQGHAWGSAKVCIVNMAELSITDSSPNQSRAVVCRILDKTRPHKHSLTRFMRLKWFES
jgi:hypothetical protein